VALHVRANGPDAALLDLPWSQPLEQWPPDQLVQLPRGISRHVVRFVRLGGENYAVKEVPAALAHHEYDLLREMVREDVPAVEAVAVITGRTDDDGEPLESALITRHLQFSLPYRALFGGTLRPDTGRRLVDALVALLVRMHLTGFFWGDCSLSNTLFRRDAGAFAAYLVDAETGELRRELSSGQRGHDLEIATVNIGGELLDLEAGGMLHPSIDAARVAGLVRRRYEELWDELTAAEVLGQGEERWRIEQRVRRLHDLGYDVAELQMQPKDGEQVVLVPRVVEPDHHARRLLRFTGLDVQENQARRLLSDFEHFKRSVDPGPHADDQEIAHRWLTEVFYPVVDAVPRSMRGKLEPAEVFHEVLEHRWFLSEQARRDVGLWPALRSYVDTVLVTKPDEKALLGARFGPPSSVDGVDPDEIDSEVEGYEPEDEFSAT
jgi:hypothetical protein